MSAENPRETEPQGLEQKGWQGQKWEYLQLYGGGLRGARGAEVFFLKDIRKNYGLEPYKEEIKQKIDSLTDETREEFGLGTQHKGLPVTLLLDLLGSRGWELVAAIPSTKWDSRSYFFKRNVQPSK